MRGNTSGVSFKVALKISLTLTEKGGMGMKLQMKSDQYLWSY